MTMVSRSSSSGMSFVLLLALLLLASCSHAAAVKTEQYIVTIDAGSSGSRVHVHKVSVPTTSQPIPKFLSAVNQKIKPGLSSFADKVSSVDQDHISGLVQFAYDNVPADAWKETPIYLKATAGMRSIDQTKAEQIMGVIRASFAGTAFLFEGHWASVISGSDEAKFSWIATNYLKDKFQTPGQDLLGVLEMGGASMQISYPVPKSVPVDNDKILEVQLGAQTHHLYAHSYLGYGLDQAQELLAGKSPDKVGVCYPPGNTFLDNHQVEGAGNYEQCYNAMYDIFQTSTCPKTPPPKQDRCSLQGTMLPHWEESKVKFVAIENFYYTTSFLTQNHNQLSDVRTKGQAYCSGSWDQLKQQYLSDKEDEFALSRYCFSAAYIMALMDYGFGIPMTDHTQVAHKVGDTDIDWAVGSVVYDILQLHHSHQGGHFRSSSSSGERIAPPIGYGTVLAFSIPCLVVVLVARRQQKKYELVDKCTES